MDLNDNAGTAGGDTGADSIAAGDGSGAIDASGLIGSTAGNDVAAGGDAGESNDKRGNSGAEPDFYKSVAAESTDDRPSNLDWLKSKNFASVDDLVASARETERSLRDGGRIKIPGENATDAERAAFHKAIGVPDKAEDYGMPVVKGADGNPVEMDSGRLQEIATIAHRHGIPKAALEGVLQELAEADVQRIAGADAQMQEKVDAHIAKWGDAKAEKIANVTAAARDLGLNREEQMAVRAALGPERALDLFERHGSRLGEDTMVNGKGQQNFGLSAAQAQKQLAEKRGNAEWSSKALIPGTPERAEYDRLNAAIAQAADREMLANLQS